MKNCYTESKEEYWYIKYTNCSKKNEQLKQQIQNIHDLIDNKVNESKELGFNFTVLTLKELKKELQE